MQASVRLQEAGGSFPLTALSPQQPVEIADKPCQSALVYPRAISCYPYHFGTTQRDHARCGAPAAPHAS